MREQKLLKPTVFEKVIFGGNPQTLTICVTSSEASQLPPSQQPISSTPPGPELFQASPTSWWAPTMEYQPSVQGTFVPLVNARRRDVAPNHVLELPLLLPPDLTVAAPRDLQSHTASYGKNVTRAVKQTVQGKVTLLWFKGFDLTIAWEGFC